MVRAFVLLAMGMVPALVGAPAGADAQFTAALVPPPPIPRVDTAARADSLRRAAMELEERMTSIKEWVDSAAAALAAQPARVPPVSPDTARMPRVPRVPRDTSRTPPDTSGARPRRPGA